MSDDGQGFQRKGMKKKFKKGLDTLFSRGQTSFKPDRQKEVQAKHFAEVRKKKTYAKLLEKELPSQLEIPDELPDRPFQADDEQSECSISDEDLSDSDIVFKDAEVQDLWTGRKGEDKNTEEAKGLSSSKRAATQPNATLKGAKLFAVPSWDDMAVEDSSSKPVKPEKKPSSEKTKPNPFKAAEKKANDALQQLQAEQEREREEREQSQQARKAYFQKRQKDRSEHLRRTKRGQPIMKNMISGFLSKLQKDD